MLHILFQLSYAMLKNHIKIIYRNVTRHPVYSLINILGLITGMTCSFLILLFVQYELQYDRFSEQSERVYRIIMQRTDLDKKFATISMPIGPALSHDFSEVEAVARLFPREAGIRVLDDTNQSNNIQFKEKQFYFADSTIFKIFSFSFIKGNPNTALSEPNSVVITEQVAEKYFGSTWFTNSNIIGSTLLMEGKFQLKVTGIVSDFPTGSHLRCDFLVSYDTMFAIENETTRRSLKSNWLYNPVYTYILLQKGESAGDFETKMPGFLAKYTNENFYSVTNLLLQPLHEIHLHSKDIVSGDEEKGNITLVYTFIGVALIILLVASINFVNLSIAHSLKRIREIGVRKALGAVKIQIVKQFLSESFLFCLIAFIVSLALVIILLPELNNLIGKDMTVEALIRPQIFLTFAIIFILISLLSCSYPAFFVSRLDTVATLKGKAAGSVSKGILIRKSLVMFQFFISIVLIISALTVYSQLELLKNKSLGFEPQKIINIPLFSENRNAVFGSGIDSSMYYHLQAFENTLLSNPSIKAVTLSSKVPGTGYKIPYGLVIPEGFTKEDNIFMSNISVDYDFIDTYGIKLLSGRSFSKDFGTDHLEACVINKIAADRLGWKNPSNAIGKNFKIRGKNCTVIGVFENFHYKSLHNLVEPLVLVVTPKLFSYVSIRLQNIAIPEITEFIEKQWQDFFPDKVFTYNFLQQDIDHLYQSEQKLGKIVSSFAFLAIFISALGLLALTTFMVDQRIKEIGVRKVLGASIFDIIALILKDFTTIVVVAFVIAVPISYYLLNQWLLSFAYHVEVNINSLLLAGIIALITAWIAVGYKSIKAASTNPTRTLRNE